MASNKSRSTSSESDELRREDDEAAKSLSTDVLIITAKEAESQMLEEVLPRPSSELMLLAWCFVVTIVGRFRATDRGSARLSPLQL